MKSILAALLVSSALLAAPKPNIIVIYSDDHGWADLGAQGVNADIRTPNLDQLARDGVRFARGYVSAPQCVPSRAGVITGRYQQRFGVEDNNKGPLPLEELTIAERLKPAGYLAGMVGKWHLDLGGDKKEKGEGKAARAMLKHMPHGQGFDEYWRGELRQFFASHDLQGKPFANAPHLVTDNRFRVVVQTEAALSFLDRRANKPEQPWFLYLAWFAPHVPLESPEPWFSKVPANLPLERRQALAMIAAMDDGLGRVRAKLREMNAEKNTLIFFVGDNGAPVKPGHWDGSLNVPLIGEKGMLTDGGIRTPFLAAWPGTLPAGTVYPHPVINLDIAATAVALAYGSEEQRAKSKEVRQDVSKSPDPSTLSALSSKPLDGVNLIPFVSGENKATPHDALYWRWRSQAAVLEFPWKLIRLGPDEQFLFDVTTPEGETKNLLALHPDIVARLNAKLKTWSDGLKPSGLPTDIHLQDAVFFADHIDKRFAPPEAKKPAAEPGSVRGWVCRGGSLAIKDGALVVTAEEGGKGNTFITYSRLDLIGPVTLTMKVRVAQGGAGFVSWRRKQEADFDPKAKVSFTWPTDGEVKVELPLTGRLLHVRIGLPKNATSMNVSSITLSHEGSPPQTWDFSKAE